MTNKKPSGEFCIHVNFDTRCHTLWVLPSFQILSPRLARDRANGKGSCQQQSQLHFILYCLTTHDYIQWILPHHKFHYVSW